jgi:hypothetical protein
VLRSSNAFLFFGIFEVCNVSKKGETKSVDILLHAGVLRSSNALPFMRAIRSILHFPASRNAAQ